jgi:hypothetical protein
MRCVFKSMRAFARGALTFLAGALIARIGA